MPSGSCSFPSSGAPERSIPFFAPLSVKRFTDLCDGFLSVPARVRSIVSPVLFVTSVSNRAAGMLESFAFCGMNGLKAVSFTEMGLSGSLSDTSATGNSPLKTQSRKCGKPCIVVFERPKP